MNFTAQLRQESFQRLIRQAITKCTAHKCPHNQLIINSIQPIRAYATHSKHSRPPNDSKKTTGQITMHSREIRDLDNLFSCEPPLVTQQKVNAQEIENAIYRLRRKLKRFMFYSRTPLKLDTIWVLYTQLKQRVGFTLSHDETLQFLRAILHVSRTTDWIARAKQICNAEHTLPDNREVCTFLVRIFSKFGDILNTEHAISKLRKLTGQGAQVTSPDLVAVWTVAYARADMPQDGEMVLEQHWPCETDREVMSDEQIYEYVFANRELLHAWARADSAEKAWARLAVIVQCGGIYAQRTREWNTLLHMHAKNIQYKYELLLQVLERMDAVRSKWDRTTYNIMMHACLIRGNQRLWKEWYKRMELAGYKPDAHTFMALINHLTNTGQWSEALRTLDQMKWLNLFPHHSPAPAVSLINIERRRSNTHEIMATFRKKVIGVVASRDAEISVEELTSVMHIVLQNPRRWVTEIALVIKCLEEGRVAESAVVDALAMRLPGIDNAALANRSFLQLLHKEGADSLGLELEAAFARGKEREVGATSGGKPTAKARILTGDKRKLFPETLCAIIQVLLSEGKVTQASRLMNAARDSGINATPHTLLKTLYHTFDGTSGSTQQLHNKVLNTRYVPPTVVPASLLVNCIQRDDAQAAKHQYERLDRFIDSFPSIEAFNSLLAYALFTRDALTLERRWRQMIARGVSPNTRSHETRILCHALNNDLLHARRAYTDMLDEQIVPSPRAVNSVVRACLCAHDPRLALTIITHAEREFAVPQMTATYNYLIIALISDSHYTRATAIFKSMVSVRDLRVPGSDVARSVERAKARISDLRALESAALRVPAMSLHAAKLMRTESRFRRAIVDWLTSRAAFSAPQSIPGYVKPAHERPESEIPSPPPPNATTFMVLIRDAVKRARWDDAIAYWRALLSFNARVDQLAVSDPSVAELRIIPYSSIVCWVCLAYVGCGKVSNAESLWNAAESDGVLSEKAKEMGIEGTLRRLAEKNKGFHKR